MSIYLSRLLLNPRSRQAMREVTHPYELHRTLMQGFPQTTDDLPSRARAEFGVLFRAEADNAQNHTTIIVQSCVEPDWTDLDKSDYLYNNYGLSAYKHKDIFPSYRKVSSGQLLRFRLKANVSKRVGDKNDRLYSKRVAIFDEESQLKWLLKKGREGGFEPLSTRVSNCGQLRSKKKGRYVTHFGVTFNGILRINDATRFIATIQHGIGPAKAFGFGLLSIARA